MRLLSILIILFVSLPGFSKTKNYEITNYHTTKELNDYLENEFEKDLERAYEFARYLNSAKSLQAPLLINVAKGRLDAFYIFEDGKQGIFVTLKKEKGIDLVTNFKKIFFHEFGHFVYHNYSAQHSRVINSPDIEIYEKALVYFSLTKPFSELFADSFAMSMLQRPDIGIPLEKRDFSLISTNIDDYKGEVRLSQKNVLNIDPHTFFNPTKQYLWGSVLEQALLNKEDLKNFIKVLLFVSNGLVDDYYYAYEKIDDENPVDVSALNKNLIISFNAYY